jgi:hypothetical protein
MSRQALVRPALIPDSRWPPFTPIRATITGDADLVRQSGERSAILHALEEAGEPLSAPQVAAATGMKVASLRRMLARMKTDGLIKGAGYGKYAALGGVAGSDDAV